MGRITQWVAVAMHIISAERFTNDDDYGSIAQPILSSELSKVNVLHVLCSLLDLSSLLSKANCIPKETVHGTNCLVKGRPKELYPFVGFARREYKD